MAGQTDIIDQIEWKSLECLNASPEHGVNNALKQVNLLISAELGERYADFYLNISKAIGLTGSNLSERYCLPWRLKLGTVVLHFTGI